MNEGQNLWNAVNLVSRAWDEIDGLLSELSKKMELALGKKSDELQLNYLSYDEGSIDCDND